MLHTLIFIQNKVSLISISYGIPKFIFNVFTSLLFINTLFIHSNI